MIGQTLGHYSVLEKIGEGGMGVVYLARDTRLDREVALKVLPTGTLSDEAARKRFRREALALAKLNHPHIAMIFDFDTQEGVDFLVMEYLPGATLNDRLRSGGLAEKETLRWGAQLAEGLAAAHEQGVVHRDLKPANLRITPDGRLKILDFGLAKLLRPASQMTTAETLGETQAGAGTLPYMAPEQLRGDAVDARSDIYAAGAVLYEMATGRRPFPETQGPRLIDAILNQAPPAPSSMNRRISSGLESIILKCVDKEPGRRYQSARELLVDLQRVGAPAPAEVVPRARGVRRSRQVLAGALAGLVVVAVLWVALNGGWRNRVLGRAAAPRIESLAVLPLVNYSRDVEQDYFADGMTDALIADLAQISALRVISRTSAMQYKGSKKPLPQIAQELNVDAVVEGSVQRSGNRVRILAQLIHGPTDTHLWAQSYERDLRDVLSLQSQLAQAIASEIKVTLTPREQAQLSLARPVNPEAHEAYLRGRYFWNKRTEEGFRRGTEYFNQAIEKDPNYALAYAGLAYTYSLMGHELYSLLDPRDAYPKANAAALRALKLDESLAEAHAVLGDVKFRYEWDWSGAEREYKRAIELNPSYTTAHQWYSHFLLPLGRAEESLAESKRALELDPLSLVINMHMGWHYLYARQYDQAIEQLRKTLDLDQDFLLAHLFLGQAYELKAMYAEAMAEFQKAIALSRGAPPNVAALGHLYAVSGKRDAARKVLEELKESSKRRFVPSYEIAVVYAGLGEKDQAFGWLQKAFEQRDSGWLVDLRVDPRFDLLRSDPRFADLVRRVGLPP